MAPINNDEINAKILDIVQSVVEAGGFELVDLAVGRHGAEVQIQATADRPHGGITIEECARLNRAIVAKVDQEGFLGDNYSLEFSSPGLDRPLASEKDFRRNMERAVRIHLNEAVQGKKEWTGIISSVNAHDVVIQAKKAEAVTVPLSKINKAVLVI